MLSTAELWRVHAEKVCAQADFSLYSERARPVRRPSLGHVAEIAVMSSPDGDRVVGREDRNLLLSWARSRTLATRLVQRSRIVLLLAEGQRVRDVARALGVSESTVRLWRGRFHTHGPKGLLTDAPGRGRKPVLPESARDALRERDPASDWMSVRQQARALGVSPATVSRWRRRQN